MTTTSMNEERHKESYYQGLDLVDFLKLFDPNKLINFCEVNIAKYKLRLGKKRSIAKQICSSIYELVAKNAVKEEDNSIKKAVIDLNLFKQELQKIIDDFDLKQLEEDKRKIEDYKQILKTTKENE